MNVALITYEYPPETGGGGIGTYVANAARMLHKHGHRVEVFAGGERSRSTETPFGASLHRVECACRADFSDAVVPAFAERYQTAGFDVVEGPEYHADAAGIREVFPEIPLVVKLHTASCILKEVNINRHLTLWDKARFLVGGGIRGQVPSPHWTYDPIEDAERKHALAADVVAAPSRSIGERMVKWWGLQREKIFHFPYPFEASNSLLNVDPDTDTQRVTFVGRLEMRKGVLDLAEAIPKVLTQCPDAHFRFIGDAQAHPRTGEDLRAVMERRLQSYNESVEFTGFVPYSEIPSYLSETDICVFPSLWENFPNVCLEAMSAARGVVGSSSGGMSEMLDDGTYGRVVTPQRPSELADAILDLLNHPEERKRLGRAARERVQESYSFEAVVPQQEACYEAAIRRHETHAT
ncbi:glycosyltransferase family 4 protein [Salinibacter grassmerensis]|uniref:glycosyltransferase family 4 protein n=1 Tax=Salinibacter grassmerensis TaxID=3040353 RepID=UPI0021E70586|nr:glycosyltransferase family 4 protein [Salinibacter grassmerensis]